MVFDGWHDEMPDDTSDDADDETELTLDRLVIELGVDELLDVVDVAVAVFEITIGGSGARRSFSVVGREILPSLDVDTEAEAAESDCEDDVDEVFSNFSLISLIL